MSAGYSSPDPSSPDPSSKEVQAKSIFGQRAAFYTTSKCHTDPEVLGRVVGMARAQQDWRALDIGTGTGHTAFALAPVVAQVVATDITPEMLAQAERLQAQNGLANVSFQVADAHNLPFDDASFDLVTCRRAAHHFARIEQAVAEMVRVLRPGGRLVIDDRSVAEDDFVDATMNELDRYHDRSHVRQYRPSQWQAMLEAAGLTVDGVEPYTRHRPLAALTGKADPEDIPLLEQSVASWDEAEREKMNYAEKDGEVYINHWYVLVAGVKG